MKKYAADYPYIAWAIALTATLGSLFFSEILKYPPCTLCWYQRICMYPLVVILAVGIIRKDKGLSFYVLPLSIFGLLVSTFQNLLYFKIISETYAPCAIGVSCTDRFLSLLGFFDIPQLSWIGFLIITVLIYSYMRYNAKTLKQ